MKKLFILFVISTALLFASSQAFPSSVSINSPSDGSYVNGSPTTISGGGQVANMDMQCYSYNENVQLKVTKVSSGQVLYNQTKNYSDSMQIGLGFFGFGWSFTIPSGTFTGDGQYRLDAIMTGSPRSDTTTTYFVIDSQPPTVAVTYPNVSVTFLTASTASVSWTATDAVSMGANPIDIYYTTAPGATISSPTPDATVWSPIALGQANTGSYSWTTSTEASPNYRIGIVARDAAGNTASNISHVFSVQRVDQDYYIATNGNDSYSGDSAHPLATIKAALIRINANRTIYINDGLYYENVYNWPAGESGITVKSINGPMRVTISGQNTSESVFTIADGTIQASIEGITITLGSAETGGGINCVPGANVTAKNCVFQNNTASFEGGGMYYGTAINCSFESNAAITGGSGGGTYNTSLVNCTFTANNASKTGGGAYGGSAINCIFTGNHAISGGGAYMANASNCQFTGNTASYGAGLLGGSATSCAFSSNSAVTGGGAVFNAFLINKCTLLNNTAQNGSAVYTTSESPSYIVNSVIANNSGSGIYKNSQYGNLNLIFCTVVNSNIDNVYGSTNVSDSILFGSNPTTMANGTAIYLNYTGIQGGALLNTGTGNISLNSTNTMFSSPSSNNYSLLEGSPCIDTGDPNSTINEDINGASRPAGSGYDMGAYEYRDKTVTLMSPTAAGIQIPAMKPYTISWEVYDSNGNPTTANYFSLYCSIEGSTLITIEADQPGVVNGVPVKTFNWSVPPLTANKARIIVVISKAPGVMTSRSQSANPFAIIDVGAPSATLSLSSQTQYLGKTSSIDWFASDAVSNILSVNLAVTTNEGKSWQILENGSSFSGMGQTIPYNPPANTNVPYPHCQVSLEVSDASGNTTLVMSKPFGIDTKAPTMEVNITTESSSASVPFSMKAYDENGISSIEIKAGENAQWQIKSVPAGTSGVIQGLSPALSIVPPLIGRHPVTFEAFDTGGNMTIETMIVTLDMTPIPQISNVTIDKMNINTASLISKTPVISANITDYHGDLTTVEVIVSSNGQSYTFSTTPESASTTDVTAYTATINTTQVLQPGNYTVSIEAFDASGHVGSSIYSNLGISSVSSITVNPKVIPNPFRPRHGQGVTITYQLSTDTDIKLMIYDITGKAVYQKEFLAGSEGGKGPNYNNNVYWNGKDDFGKFVANGAYIYLITSDKKVLFKGQMAVMD